MDNPFELRRINDPQAVIDDLLAQITRQATTIYKQNLEIQELDKARIKFEKELEKLRTR